MSCEDPRPEPGDGEAAALRRRLRELIAEHIPEDFLGAFSDDAGDFEVTQRFCRILAEEGLLCASWPAEHGGADASPWSQAVLGEEMWAHHEPRGPQYMGVNWVGPAIMAFGTEEQKRFHLPRIASGETVWCQGFSEPEAGSDLAGVRTRARPDGEGWVLRGQKVWTSYALLADWCFLLARSNEPSDGNRRRGLTVFLIPTDAPGLEVRPIATMLGNHHLNELFLDGVRAGPEQVLGEVGAGWRVVGDALAHERVGIARYARAERLLQMTLDEIGPGIEQLPHGVREGIVRSLVRSRIARLLAYRVVADSNGSPSGAEAAVARVASTLNDQQTAEVLMQAHGSAAIDARDDGGPLHGAIEDYFRYSQAATVAAGTVEIQRTIIARSVLGAAR